MKTAVEYIEEQLEASYKDAFNDLFEVILVAKQMEKKQMESSIELEKVNRVEVIDQKGRSYVNWKPTNKTELSLQDDGKTLKIFISNYP